jgi:hypothetical protein
MAKAKTPVRKTKASSDKAGPSLHNPVSRKPTRPVAS